MKVGVISDVHSNTVALRAVLEDMPAVDALVNAGDVVGYNPWPRECVEAMWDPTAFCPEASVPATPVPSVMGNHDRAVYTDTAFRFNHMAKAGVEHARKQLDDEHFDWLGDLPDERLLLDGKLKIVHGHPDDPDHYTYPSEFSPRLLDDEDVLVMGHTHVQAVEKYGDGIVLNPGSVGQPRDGDPKAAYAVVDLDAMDVDTHRVGYDVDQVLEAVAEADLPDRIGTRLQRGE